MFFLHGERFEDFFFFFSFLFHRFSEYPYSTLQFTIYTFLSLGLLQRAQKRMDLLECKGWAERGRGREVLEKVKNITCVCEWQERLCGQCSSRFVAIREDWSKEIARNEGRCVRVRLHASEHSEKFSRRTRVYLHLCVTLHAHACIYIYIYISANEISFSFSLSLPTRETGTRSYLCITECIHLAASLPDTYPPPTS